MQSKLSRQTMQSNLRHYFLNCLHKAADDMLKYSGVSMPPQEAYEQLIDDKDMLEKFHTVAGYLVPQNCRGAANVLYEQGGTYQNICININFETTPEWPAYLFSKYDLHIRQGTNLHEQFKLPIRVMTEWHALITAFEALTGDIYFDTSILAFLLPWLRDLALESNWLTDTERFVDRDLDMPNRRRNSEMEFVKQDMKKILERKVPNSFPTVSRALNDVFMSGNRLFTQYRMVRDQKHPQSVLTIKRDASDVLWVKNEINESFKEWREELAERKRARMKWKLPK